GRARARGARRRLPQDVRRLQARRVGDLQHDRDRVGAGAVPAPLVSAANAEAFRRLVESDPVLVDIRPAIEVVPGMTETTVLTSGPPMAPDEYTGGPSRAVPDGPGN